MASPPRPTTDPPSPSEREGAIHLKSVYRPHVAADQPGAIRIGKLAHHLFQLRQVFGGVVRIRIIAGPEEAVDAVLRGQGRDHDLVRVGGNPALAHEKSEERGWEKECVHTCRTR